MGKTVLWPLVIVGALAGGGLAPGLAQGAGQTTTTTVAAAAADPTALIGKPAPDFLLPDQNNKTRSLSAVKGRWVVLAFYPADMTRG